MRSKKERKKESTIFSQVKPSMASNTVKYKYYFGALIVFVRSLPCQDFPLQISLITLDSGHYSLNTLAFAASDTIS